MLIKEYHDAKAFLEEYKTILVEREAASQSVIYDALQNIKESPYDKGIFGAVMDGEKIILLFCNVLPHNLMIYAVNDENIASAAAYLADFLEENHIIINGISAKHDICLGFMEQYMKNISCSFSEAMEYEIMELRKVNDLTPVEGIQRLALPEEAKLVAQWMIDFQMEAQISEMDYEVALAKANSQIEADKIYFYENEEQQIVSMAIVERELIHGVVITYVFTPEEYRGEGYAAANLYYLSKELLEKGFEFCSLYVDKKNTLSNRSYEKVGYELVEDVNEYKMILNEI